MNRPFADANYTRHCWECAHAHGWHDAWRVGAPFADCELMGREVSKFDSPENPCSAADALRGCRYERRKK